MWRMPPPKKILSALLLLVLAYLAFWPVDVDPAAWECPPDPGFTGDFSHNTKLAAVEILGKGTGIGPEDVDVDAEGRIYGGFRGGRIMRFDAKGGSPEVFADTGGRPLGMEFDAQGNLVVCDAHKGLLRLAKDGNIEVLATEADGVPFRFTDDVDVAKDGKIYFSDASHKFPIERFVADLLEHRPNGRFLVHDPATKQTKVLLKDLYFANGVAVAPDQTFVLVVETGLFRVQKYWLAGPKQGSAEVVLQHLPGFPDGISSNGRGTFWIAMASPRKAYMDRLTTWPAVRKVLARLPVALQPAPDRHGFVLGIDGDGKVLHNLQDPSPGSFSPVTSVEQVGDTLYLGSLSYDALARIPAP